MMFSSFHMRVMMLLFSNMLYMLVRYASPISLMCLRCLMLTIACPVKLLFLLCSIASWTCVVVSVIVVVCGLCVFLSMCLFVFVCVGKLLNALVFCRLIHVCYPNEYVCCVYVIPLCVFVCLCVPSICQMCLCVSV